MSAMLKDTAGREVTVSLSVHTNEHQQSFSYNMMLTCLTFRLYLLYLPADVFFL